MLRVLSQAQLPADVREEAATLDAEGEIRAWVGSNGAVNFVADNIYTNGHFEKVFTSPETW